MDTEKLCLYCMEETGGTGVCPACGGDANAPVPAAHLPLRTVLAGRFLIGRAVGQDGNGIVYNALDMNRGIKLRIREYLPRDCAQRVAGSLEVGPLPGAEQRFETGLSRLRATAESADNPEQRRPYFMENGTAYVLLRRANGASGAAGQAEGEEDEEEVEAKRVTKQMIIMGSVIAVVVVAVLAIVLAISRNALDRTTDPLAGLPTAVPGTSWVPPTPAPTASVSPTATDFTIVDPGNPDWQEEDPAGDLDDGEEEAQPTDEPEVVTPEPGDEEETIDADSSKAQIKKLQQRLRNLGWLNDKADGVYGKNTRSAVKAFQKYVNQEYDAGLSEDGIADPVTLNWLNWEGAPAKPDPTAKPTATPKPTQAPEPTAQPTKVPDQTAEPEPTPEVVNEYASREAILEVQNRLVFLGWLDAAYATGEYNTQTRQAVFDYQRYINQTLQAGLPEDGTADAVTLEWIRWDDAPGKPEATQAPTEAPTQAPTEAPTVEPTQAPTEAPTEEPTEEPEPEEEETVDEQSSAEAIQAVQDRLVALGWLDAASADGSYNEATRSAVRAYQQYINLTQQGDQLPEDGTADAKTLEWLRWEGAPSKPTAPPTEEPTQEPTEEPTQEPTEEPTQAPTEAPTAEPTEEPTAEPEPEQPEGDRIDENSDPESIASLQGYLINLRWLTMSEPSGVYDEATRQAVKDFQAYANEQAGAGLEVSGVADSSTLELLLEAGEELANPS